MRRQAPKNKVLPHRAVVHLLTVTRVIMRTIFMAIMYADKLYELLDQVIIGLEMVAVGCK